MTEPSTSSGIVDYRTEGDVAVVVMDDGKANALGFDLIGAVDEALDRAVDEAGAVALVGRAGKFSAGFDLSVMTSGPENARELLGRGAELGLRLFELPIPVVLGVTGHALAMGGILLCCGDVRIGADGPSFRDDTGDRVGCVSDRINVFGLGAFTVSRRQ